MAPWCFRPGADPPLHGAAGHRRGGRAPLFGMSAVKDDADIDMVINLEQWKDGAMYDRLGLENLYTVILDVQVPP
mgnify:CR=1 FL=1